jgi:hypothetical protein
VSSINTVFQPMAAQPVSLVSGSPVQANPSPSNNAGDCFRIANTTTPATLVAIRVAWGRTAATTPVPVLATPSFNTIYLTPNESIYLCLPADSFFNVSASGTAEVLAGQGGAGG